MSNKEILSAYFEHDIRPLLTDSDIDMLKEYTSFKSYMISSHMLGINSDPDFYKDWIINTINRLNEIINLSHLPKSLVVYHGMGDKMLDYKHINDYKKECNTITTKSFLSTSLSIDTAESFTFQNRGHKNVLMINLPTNYCSLWLENISLNKGEEELLLLPNQEYVLGDSKEIYGITYTKVYPKK